MNHSTTAFTLKMATVLCVLLANAAVAAGDPGRGARMFQPCMACHSVTAGEHSTGPSLANLWNRKAGAAEGFPRYSAVLKDADFEWNEKNLDKWLSDPRQFVPGTSMSFKGIQDAKEREDVIAYLKAVSENMAPAIPPQSGMMGTRRRQGG